MLQKRKSIKRKKGGRHRKTAKSNKMNCSPMVEGKTLHKETCFTPEALKKIRDSYNASHREDPIHHSNPDSIWHELKTRLTGKCEKEDCWLKEIKDTQIQRDIDTYVFAPDRPPEWTNSPNEWLSNIDILDVLRQYEKTYPHFKFIGPTPIDFDTRPPNDGGKCVWEELCHLDLGKNIRNGIRDIGIIFNLDTHDKGGSHWVSLFVHMDISLGGKPFAFFFDSAGDKAPAEVMNLVKRIQEQWLKCNENSENGKSEKRNPMVFIQNAPHTHQYSNTECGMYSLLFIVTMLTGKQKGGSKENRILSMNRRISLFLKGKITDKEVEKYRQIYFNAPDN